MPNAPGLEPLNQDIPISPATPADAAGIKRLLQQCGLPVDDVRDDLAGLDFVVAKARGELVGAAALQPLGHFALLRSVAVAQPFRGKGVARALAEQLFVLAKNHEMQCLYLLTTNAGDYFARLGFEPIARENAPRELRATAQFATLCPASAAVMARVIR